METNDDFNLADMVESLRSQEAKLNEKLTEIREELVKIRRAIAALEGNVIPHGGLGRVDIKWESIDWIKRDVDIARDTGVSRQRIEQIRKKLGKPNSPYQCKSPKETIIVEWINNNRSREGRVTLQEIKEELETAGKPCSLPYIHSILKREGFKLTRSDTSPFEVINWGIPNRYLAKIWGMGSQIVSSKRYLGRKEHSSWNNKQTPENCPTLATAINEEIEKKERWLNGDINSESQPEISSL